MFWCAKYFFTLLLVSVSSSLESPDSCCFRLWLNPSCTRYKLLKFDFLLKRSVSWGFTPVACSVFMLGGGEMLLFIAFIMCLLAAFFRCTRSCKRQDYAATPSFSTHLRTDPTSVDLDLHEQGLWKLTQQSAQHLLFQDDFWLSWKRLENPPSQTGSYKKNLKRIIRKHNRILYFSEIYFKDDVRDEMSEA